MLRLISFLIGLVVLLGGLAVFVFLAVTAVRILWKIIVWAWEPLPALGPALLM